MTEFEKKAEEIRQNAEQAKSEAQAAKAEAAAAKAEAEAAKNELAGKVAELKTAQTNIDNLDKSVKEQAKSIEDLKKALDAAKSVSFKADFRRALEAAKPEIEKALNSKADKLEVTLELKTAYPIGTGNVDPNNRLSVMADPTVYAAVPAANVFILAFGLRPRTANKLGWIESTNQPVVDYVAELAQNTNLSDVSFSEKSRQFGKLAHKMQISTEFEDWFEQLYNYCVNEGIRMIEAKLDYEIYNGAGADTNSTTQRKIYGLKSQATAFSALASHAVEKANAADVIFDAVDQIGKAGFHANVAFVTWTILRTIKSIKDENGNYLYDKISGMLSGIRVFPSDNLASGEILVADTNAVEVYAGNSYELEFLRNGDYDAYDVYFRKAAQVKVPTPNKKGLIYVASVATAIAALAPTD